MQVFTIDNGHLAPLYRTLSIRRQNLLCGMREWNEMQFLEWSAIGLRSARHVFSHKERKSSVTLFPMVHLGEPGFYETVYADAAAHHAVVLEGIKSPVSRRLTRSYRWIRPERLGLMVQPKFVRNDMRVLHADISAAEFENIWQAAPWYERTIVEYGAAIRGLWLRLMATRTSLGRELSTTDLPKRDEVLAWNEQSASMLEALITARDTALCSKLSGLLAQEDYPRSIAVIYGAGHMGTLAHMLYGTEFRLVESRWMTVFGS